MRVLSLVPILLTSVSAVLQLELIGAGAIGGIAYGVKREFSRGGAFYTAAGAQTGENWLAPYARVTSDAILGTLLGTFVSAVSWPKSLTRRGAESSVIHWYESTGNNNYAYISDNSPHNNDMKAWIRNNKISWRYFCEAGQIGDYKVRLLTNKTDSALSKGAYVIYKNESDLNSILAQAEGKDHKSSYANNWLYFVAGESVTLDLSGERRGVKPDESDAQHPITDTLNGPMPNSDANKVCIVVGVNDAQKKEVKHKQTDYEYL